MAALFDIPLVFYGENESEYGNPIQDTETAERDWTYFTGDDRSKIYLGGVSIIQLTEEFQDIAEFESTVPWQKAKFVG